MVNYREAYGIHASNGILFNHESPLRGETFVTRKITRAAAAIQLGKQDRLYLGNLDAKRDWGHAREYVRGMWLMLQQESPDDYVLATGQTTKVRDFVNWAFEDVGLQIEWRGEGINEKGFDRASGEVMVEVDPRYFRPDRSRSADRGSSKGQEKLGWAHETTARELVPRDGKRRSQSYANGHDHRRGVKWPAIRLKEKRSGSPVIAEWWAQPSFGVSRERTATVLTAPRAEVDLKDQTAIRRWLADNKPEAVFLAAAKVGGILANDTYPAEFLYDNLMIEANIIDASYRNGVEKLLFLGSSCIYPKFAQQPISESALLTGELEPTNEWYAIAKIAGIKLAQAYRKQYSCDFISAMPTNLYGPGDNFDLKTSHVLPALIRKTHQAKVGGEQQIVIWGTGTPRREFLHVDDCADACVHLMKVYSEYEHVNVGSGEDLTILELTQLVCEVVGFKGEIATDPSKPDGTPRKLLSVERLNSLGWRPTISLRDGVASTYASFVSNQPS